MIQNMTAELSDFIDNFLDKSCGWLKDFISLVDLCLVNSAGVLYLGMSLRKWGAAAKQCSARPNKATFDTGRAHCTL